MVHRNIGRTFPSKCPGPRASIVTPLTGSCKTVMSQCHLKKNYSARFIVMYCPIILSQSIACRGTRFFVSDSFIVELPVPIKPFWRPLGEMLMEPL